MLKEETCSECNVPGLQFYLRGVFRLQCTGGLIDKIWMTCRQHRINVVETLKKTGNTLVIAIKPAAAEAKRRMEAYPYSEPFVQVSPVKGPLSLPGAARSIVVTDCPQAGSTSSNCRNQIS